MFHYIKLGGDLVDEERSVVTITSSGEVVCVSVCVALKLRDFTETYKK